MAPTCVTLNGESHLTEARTPCLWNKTTFKCTRTCAHAHSHTRTGKPSRTSLSLRLPSGPAPPFLSASPPATGVRLSVRHLCNTGPRVSSSLPLPPPLPGPAPPSAASSRPPAFLPRSLVLCSLCSLGPDAVRSSTQLCVATIPAPAPCALLCRLSIPGRLHSWEGPGAGRVQPRKVHRGGGLYLRNGYIQDSSKT